MFKSSINLIQASSNGNSLRKLQDVALNRKLINQAACVILPLAAVLCWLYLSIRFSNALNLNTEPCTKILKTSPERDMEAGSAK